MSRLKKVLLVATTAAIAVLLVVVVVPTLFPGPSHIFRNQFRAARNIRAMNLAQSDYARLYPSKGFACSFAELGEKDSKREDAMLARVLAEGRLSGYHFELACTQSSDSKAVAYKITAAPLAPEEGKYALCADQSGEIWYNENGQVGDCLIGRQALPAKYREWSDKRQ